MAQISTQLRKFKEPTKEELTRTFFSLPPDVGVSTGSDEGASKQKGAEDTSGTNGKGQMEINAVLSLGQEGVEDSYVRIYYQPFIWVYRDRLLTCSHSFTRLR